MPNLRADRPRLAPPAPKEKQAAHGQPVEKFCDENQAYSPKIHAMDFCTSSMEAIPSRRCRLPLAQ